MKRYEQILDRMHFEIGSTLMDNDFSRKGIGGIEPQPESEILRSSQRTYMNLKVMMMRLERELFGGKKYEKDETEISDRDTSKNKDTEIRQTSNRDPRGGDFPC